MKFIGICRNSVVLMEDREEVPVMDSLEALRNLFDGGPTRSKYGG
jgi:hypothetical protein